MSSTIFSTDISSCSLPPLYVSPVSLLSVLSLNMSVTFLYNFSFAHNFLFLSSQASSDLDLAKSIILFFLSLQLASCNPLYISLLWISENHDHFCPSVSSISCFNSPPPSRPSPSSRVSALLSRSLCLVHLLLCRRP